MNCNKEMSRRDFCKLAVASAAGLSMLPVVLKESMAEFTRKKGLVIEKEAMWYKSTGDGTYRCELCPNRCSLKDGVRSICLVREGKNGKLHTLVYGNPTSIHVDPIEKKPLFHYYPGKSAFSIATAGCNFTCLNCQNWQISQFPPEDTLNYKLLPEKTVMTAKLYKSPIIAYTYSEPSIFYEYMLETSKIAKDHEIKNVSITNGYLNPKPVKELCRYLGAANVDLKGFSDDFYMEFTDGRLQPVLDTINIMKENGVHVEITNLVLPGQNDSDQMLKKMCRWIVSNPGIDVPLHFSRFSPMYKLKNLQHTPEKTLRRARKIALDMGIRYVYIGNIPLLEAEDTFCHNCNKLLVDRSGYRINKMNIMEGCCKYCHVKIPGVF